MYNYSDVSLSEYPGELSLILYSGGCNFRCPFCYNSSLFNEKPLSFKAAKDIIDEHKGFCTALVLSGGEPLLNPNINKIINYAKSKGFKIKLNSNGFTTKSLHPNAFVKGIDYANISIKGLPMHYNLNPYISKLESWIPNCGYLEYSFVYTPSLWSNKLLNDFHHFLKSKIASDWNSIFSRSKWSQPNIFTILQMQTGECLDPKYNQCKSPNYQECKNLVEIFSDIPSDKIIIETKEEGRKNINI